MSLSTYISQLFTKAAQKFSGFERDAEIVKIFLGVDLTPQQFDQYKAAHGGRTLHKVFGSGEKIFNKYFRQGIPAQKSGADSQYDLLRHLANAGIVFDIETPGANDRLFNKLFSTVQRQITVNENPGWASEIPAPYCASPRLARAANAVLKLNGMSTPSVS